MNPTVQSAIVSGVAIIVIAVITQRNNRRGQDATNVLEGKRVELDGKKVDLSVLMESVEDLRRRLADVETQLGREKDQRRLSNGYARTLAQVLREHDMAVPPQPEGLELP